MANNRIFLVLCLICVGMLFTAGSINTSLQKPSIIVPKQESAFNFNDNMILLLSAGQKRLIADLFWIVTLLESDVDHYKGKDLNSWLYLRFKTIITLDPLFLSAYRFGGKYLSIIKDDLLGAKEIFELGLKKYPNDYNLLFDAAFLYAFELQDFKRGGDLYRKLTIFPKAPEFIQSIVNKIDFEVHNDLNLTFKVVSKIWEDTPKDTNLKIKLKFDLYHIKAELDLKCLNNKESNCEKVDFFGNPYILNQDSYSSKIPLRPYRFKIKGEAN